MSTMSVWEDSGQFGGSGFFWRDGVTDVWKFRPWTEVVQNARPSSRVSAVELLKKWTKLYNRHYALVQCSSCHCFHPTGGTSGWTGDVCNSCKESEKKMNCSKCNAYTANYTTQTVKSKTTYLCENCQLNLQIVEAAQKPLKPKGEVTRLPKSNSPMWTTQWSVVGSAKMPYIISRRIDGYNGSTTGDGFACSCPAFTRNTPREDCKHILKVRLYEGMNLTPTVGALVPAHHATEYAKFLKEQARKKRAEITDGSVKMVGDATGRKFR